MPLLSFQSVLRIIQTVLNILVTALSAFTDSNPQKDDDEKEG